MQTSSKESRRCVNLAKYSRSNVAHYLDYEHLKELLSKDTDKFDIDKIEKAYQFALESHGDQRRVSGVPYILHPTSVACVLVELGMDTDSIAAALLHDVIEDTDVTLETVRRIFGEDVSSLIDGVTKLTMTKIQYSNREEEQAENIRKMLMAMSNDIRVIIIKLADRLHNMRTIKCMPEQKRRDKSLENMEIYAPIAHRLGIKAVKDEMEDLSLQYLDPVGYREIEEALMLSEGERDKFIEKIRDKIIGRIKGQIPTVYISGRVKSVNSIYRKTFMQGKTIEQIFDIFAIRVIVDTTNDCYNVLGVIHDLFQPIPNRFKDYISTPKPNMYQSLHTTVFDKDGIPFEVQIRTWDMQYTAEYGIAAHWKYKLGINVGKHSILENINDMKKMIKDQLEEEDYTDLIRSIKNDLSAQNDVYVFTPKGDVKILPLGSTVIDLAYAIHTGVGNRMMGAKVDGRIVPIDYQVKTGEIVEILTQKESHGPNRDWLQIVKTSAARSKIRSWFKKEKREENIIEGKEETERQLKRYGITNITEEERIDLFASVMAKNSCSSLDDFYASVGYGGIHLANIMTNIKEEYHKKYLPNMPEVPALDSSRKYKKVRSGVVIKNIDDCLVKFSKCCSPLPGDNIIGYITRGHGVSIHKMSCANVPLDTHCCEEPDRWLEVHWATDVKESYNSILEIVAKDREGFLADTVTQLTNMHISIHAFNSRQIENNQTAITVTFDVNSTDHLKVIMTKLSNIDGVVSVRRL